MQHMIQSPPEQFCNMLVVKRYVHLLPLLACSYQSFVAQATQLVRNCRLAQTDELHQVSHVDFVIQQSRQDTQASWIGERFKKRC